MVTGRVLRVLEQMNQGVARMISGRRVVFDRVTGMWSHLPTAQFLELAGLIPLGEYP